MIRDWVELNMTPGIGPRAAAKLLERFGSAEAVYKATRAELEQLRLPPEAVDTIIARDLLPRAEAEITAVKQLGGDILLLDDGVYPSSLREIYDPPIVLYVKGAWSDCLDRPCIGVVGSRRCSTYGQNAANMLARDLAERGVTVVSGFARGIDAAAHRGALEANGRTVAVLGTGIDEVYPREHRKLAAEILDHGGALVSQLERDAGINVFTIAPAMSTMFDDLIALQPDATSWPIPSFATVRGTVLDAKQLTYRDAVLYLGPPSAMTFSRLPPSLCSDARYLEMRLERVRLTGAVDEESRMREQLKRECASHAPK